MKHLFFVRHGLSEMNKQGVYSGQTETPLTLEGIEQAKMAGQYAKKLGIQKIVCSPFSRAYDTGKIIAEAIDYPLTDIELNSLFIERNMGVMEGQPWSPDLNIDGFADVETVDSLFERAKLGLEFLESLSEDVVLVVSHGSTGRMLRHILHPDIPFRGSKGFLNGDIVRLL